MMDDLRLAAVAARVVAWHNRHPLARRISAAHVHAVGYVGLPFAGAPSVASPPPSGPELLAGAAAEPADTGMDLSLDFGPAGGAGPDTPEAGPPPGSLRERALARARQQAAAGPDAVPPAVAAAAPAAGTALPPDDQTPLPALASLRPDFSEDFIDPLSPRAVAKFALRAGQGMWQAPTDGPLRQVHADGNQPGRQPVRVYLLSAVIETDTRKSRVLLGTGLTAPVLGRRIFDSTRVAGVVALGAVVVGLPTWWLQAQDESAALQVSAPAAAAAAAAASAVALAAPAADAASAAVTDVAMSADSASAADTIRAAASAPAAPAEAVATAAAPEAPAASAAQPAVATAASAVTARPGLAPAPLVLAPALPSAVRAAPQAGGPGSIRPLISEADKAQARQARQAATAASGAGAEPPQGASPSARPAPLAAAPAPAPAPVAPRTAMQIPELAPQRAPPGAAPAPAAAVAATSAKVFALSTRPLRTRAEAEQVEVAMRALLRSVGAGDTKVQVLPQGDDWRVVGWPFAQRADADKARSLLVSRGMRVEVVSF